MRWLERYMTEGSPRLKHFAEITASSAKVEQHSRSGGGHALVTSLMPIRGR